MCVLITGAVRMTLAGRKREARLVVLLVEVVRLRLRIRVRVRVLLLFLLVVVVFLVLCEAGLQRRRRRGWGGLLLRLTPRNVHVLRDRGV